MIELKVGDRVKYAIHVTKEFLESNDPYIRGYRELSGIEPIILGGVITDINGSSVLVDNFGGILHRWQVRKLVKMKKCDECNGVPEHATYGVGTGGTIRTVFVCGKCNGKGKVKV